MAISLAEINQLGDETPIRFDMELPTNLDQSRILINETAILMLMRLTGIGILHIKTFEDEDKPDLAPSGTGDVTTAEKEETESPDPSLTNAGRILPGPNLSRADKWVESTILLNRNIPFDKARNEGRSSLDPSLWADLIDLGVRKGIFDISKKHMLNKDTMTSRDVFMQSIERCFLLSSGLLLIAAYLG